MSSKSKIVEATGASANASPMNPAGKTLASMIETAMTAAVLEASAEGVTDPDEIRARMLAARDRVKGEVTAQMAAALAEE